MNTYAQVRNLIEQWKAEGLEKTEIVRRTAEACMGWPYVWGGYGQTCNPTNRQAYAERSACPEAEAATIRKKCQRLNGSSNSCSGCKYYPGSSVLFFDCRGFTRWLLQQVGISLSGAGATSQWNTASNWLQKGTVDQLPADKIACMFWQDKSNPSVMAHTGMYMGNGVIIHCSGEVIQGRPTDRGWTHYAIPKGLDGSMPVPTPGTDKPTLRRGSSGEYVTLMQTKLIQRGYSLEPYGADGKFGAKTETAVKAFQRDNSLTADGICGPRTWTALEDGKTVLYTVTVQHLSKTAAEDIVNKFGGVMTAEGGDA